MVDLPLNNHRRIPSIPWKDCWKDFKGKRCLAGWVLREKIALIKKKDEGLKGV